MQEMSKRSSFLGVERINPPRLVETGPDSSEVNRLYSDLPRQQDTVAYNKILSSVSVEAYSMSKDIRAAFDEFTVGERQSFLRYFMLCPEFFDWDVSDMNNLAGNIRTRSGHELFLRTFQDSDVETEQLLIGPNEIHTLPKTITDTHAVARSGDFLLTAQPQRHDNAHEVVCDGDVFAVQYSAMRISDYDTYEHAARKAVKLSLQHQTLIGSAAVTHSIAEA